MPAQVDEIAEEKTLPALPDGTIIKLRLRPRTRWARSEAYQKACLAFQAEHQRGGCSPIAFEEEYAKSRIISWHPMKTHVSNGGWRLLTEEAGDAICAALGTDEAFLSVFPKVNNKNEVILSKEAEAAKNLPSASPSTMPIQTPSLTSNSGPQ